MKVLVRSTKLFYDGGEGEAPLGSTRTVDLLQHPEFLRNYGHAPLARLEEYALTTIARWNRMQPNYWRYELIDEE